MQLNFTAKDLEITPALKAHATLKLTNLQRHFKNISYVDLVLRVEKSNQVAEANLHIDHADIHATAEGKDMYLVIDALVAKLETQLGRHKERIQDKRQDKQRDKRKHHDQTPTEDTE